MRKLLGSGWIGRGDGSMLGVMLQKLWHKKWMVVCLLLGIVLLVATVVSFPMYRKAAYDRMLADEFTEYLETEETGRHEISFG